MSKSVGLVMGLLGLAVLASACGATTTPKPKPKAATVSASAGGKLFAADCAVCHRSDGSGGKTIGTATSADLRQSALKPLYHNSTKLLERAILNGKDQSDQPLAAEMIRWQGTLSKGQVDNVIAYLKTLKSSPAPQPTPPATTSSTTYGTTASTTANPAAGAQLFASNCASCHRADASGGETIGTATSADLRQSALKPDYHNSTALLERAILDGKDESNQPLNTVMPRWRGTLSKTQVDNIIAYLETLK